jgi:tetratricopeptide (TPR) repeat protein
LTTLPSPEELRSFLSTQSKERLVELLVDAVFENEGLMGTLALDMVGVLPEGSALASLRATIDESLQLDRYLGYGEAFGYAVKLESVAKTLEGLLKNGKAEEVVELAEHALATVEEALEQVDDSDGDVYVFLERMQEIHLAACQMAQPDPDSLARRLFAWELQGGGWDTFHGAAETYQGVLGDRGLQTYRELAETEWSKIPPLPPGSPSDWSGGRSQITHIMESLARVAGDVEALVTVKSRDLSSPVTFLRIAEVYQEAGQRDRALEWAERGLAAFPQAPGSHLRRFVADAYQTLQRPADAMALLWTDFSEHPSDDAYNELGRHARQIQQWPEWRNRALELLRERARAAGKQVRPPQMKWPSFQDEGTSSLLVSILIRENEVEEAWSAAQEFGCGEYLWLDLAKLREQTDPDDSLPIYRRHVDQALALVNESGYQTATGHLRQIRDMLKEHGRSQEFDVYLAAVRQEHKRKRKFLAILDAAKL